ncbi:MAG TPA: ABC transporter substrate-binding protein [Acidimicrobiales bacterium]|jgi:peptide/nickel transport system substrate-binding protein|nr:ABC transporter substrate-binding protein [Acidimicrobiales bacterium]
MRSFRTVSLAAVFLVLATACGGGSSNKSSNQSAATTVAPDNPNAALRVGAVDDQYLLAPTKTSDATLGLYPLNTNIVETLATLSPDYTVVPALATSWELRPPNTWRFHLRTGVKFQDGQPFNAAAVKSGLFDRLAKVGGGTLKAGPDSAVVVDDNTIDFTPTAPNLRVPEQMVHPQDGVIAPGSDLTKKPVGTGPFRFVDYAPKEHITVERNPDYWGPKAKVAKITFTFYPDANARRLALESDQVDAIFDVPHQDVSNLKSKGFNIQTSAVGAYDTLLANIHGKPGFDILSDVNVRQAIAMGIDRPKIIAGVLDGLATPDQTIVAPSSLAPYTTTVKGFTFDAAKAKSMLDAAGWTVGAGGIRAKAGRQLKLTLVTGFPSAAALDPIPTFLQSEMKDIGIDLAINSTPDSATYGSVMASGDGDLFIEQGNQNDANPGFLPTLLFYTGPGSGGGGNYQALFAPGGKFDQLIGPSLTEPNPDTVRKEVADAMHEFIDVQAVGIPLAGIYRIYGLSSKVKGFVPHPASLHVQWGGVSLAS